MAQSVQRVLDYLRNQTVTLTVLANGGSVAIEVEHEPGVWVASDTLSEDGAYSLEIGGAKVRVSPTGGATYEVHS